MRKIIRQVTAVAEADRQRILELTNEGRIEAKAKGVKFGRKPKINRDKIVEMRKQGIGATKISRELGVGRSTVKY